LESALIGNPILIGEKQFHLNPQMAVELYYYFPSVLAWSPSIPLLILHGTEDNIVSYKDSEIFANQNSNNSVRLITIDGCNHGMQEKIDIVFASTLNFFKC
jgi:pimeloyl-ACP methyl ester carboxylesterase